MRLAMVAAVSFCLAAAAPGAQAARGDARGDVRAQSSRPAAAVVPAASRPSVLRDRAGGGLARSAFHYGGISCVPYARAVTGMDIRGNGREWWHNAAGRYHRSQRPAEGAILSFPGTGGMPMGHVAVVSRVVHQRMIEIDHANWGGPGIRRGMVMRDVRVVDVSPDNSWTRVRVQVGWDRDTFGREYPTHGFIHNRPATAFADAGPDESPVRAVAYTSRRVTEPRAASSQPRSRAQAQQRRAPDAAPRVAQASSARR